MPLSFIIDFDTRESKYQNRNYAKFIRNAIFGNKEANLFVTIYYDHEQFAENHSFQPSLKT